MDATRGVLEETASDRQDFVRTENATLDACRWLANRLAHEKQKPCELPCSSRSRKPLSVFGGPRVRIPPPPLNQAALPSEPLLGGAVAVSTTSHPNPWRSTDVHGSPLIK